MSSLSWFGLALLPWYRQNRRKMPWRGTKDPYLIWLSEVVLQQTQVAQGMAYYQAFAQRYPTIRQLAQAKEEEVLKLWQGLGYYSRARNLLVAADQVMNEHGGVFPQRYAHLLKLKGVGAYTAAAIASISADEPVAAVDGNVYRVLARVFGLNEPADTGAGKAAFAALAKRCLTTEAPGEHNQAVMELGALVCRPRNPNCGQCPLRSRCAAYGQSRVAELPVKMRKTAMRDRYFNYLFVLHDNGTFLLRRTEKDVWLGLYELPLIESGASLGRASLLKKVEEHTGNSTWVVSRKSPVITHLLSHQRLHIRFWQLSTSSVFQKPSTWHHVVLEDIHRYAVPKPIERYFAELTVAAQEAR
jgi:A/G-specific adenine glycosylase